MARNIEVEDTGTVSVKWRSGALGSMNVTMLTYPKNLEGSITILGEKGSVRVGGMAVNEIQHWEFSEPHAMDEDIKQASYATTSVYGFGHPLYYDNVIKTMRGEATPETDGREGLKSLELLIAMYLSARWPPCQPAFGLLRPRHDAEGSGWRVVGLGVLAGRWRLDADVFGFQQPSAGGRESDARAAQSGSVEDQWSRSEIIGSPGAVHGALRATTKPPG